MIGNINLKVKTKSVVPLLITLSVSNLSFMLKKLEYCAYLYLNVVMVTTAGGAFQLEGSKSVINSISTVGLNSPTAKGVCWVVVGKVQ